MADLLPLKNDPAGEYDMRCGDIWFFGTLFRVYHVVPSYASVSLYD